MSDFKIGGGDSFLSSIGDKLRLAELKRDTPKIGSIGKGPKKAEEAATQFESVLVGQMLKSMWSSVPKKGLLSGSSEEELYQEMLQKEVAQHIAKYQSFGIKDMVMDELKKRGEL